MSSKRQGGSVHEDFLIMRRCANPLDHFGPKQERQKTIECGKRKR